MCLRESGSSIHGDGSQAGVEDTLSIVPQVGGLDGHGSQAQEGQNHS